MPKEGPESEARRQAVKARFAGRNKVIADRYRAKLVELYGEQKGRKVKYAEAFELCEYGGRASKEELEKLFIVD